MNLKNLVEGSFIADLIHDISRQLTADIHEELEKLEARIAKLENAANKAAPKAEADTVAAKSAPKAKTAKARSGRRRKEPAVCSVEGCDKPSRCKGLCLYHYQKMRAKIKSDKAAEAEAEAKAAQLKQERLEQIKPVIRKSGEVAEAANAGNEPVVNISNESNEFVHPSQQPIV